MSYMKLDEFNPDPIQIANQHIRAGRLDEAKALLQPIVRGSEYIADAWLLLGQIELEKKNNLGAVANFFTASKLAVTNEAFYEATYLLGRALYLIGEYSMCLKTLAGFPRSDKQWINQLWLVGASHFGLANYETAVSTFSALIESTSAAGSSKFLGSVYALRAKAYRMLKQVVKAREDVSQALRLDPENVIAKNLQLELSRIRPEWY